MKRYIRDRRTLRSNRSFVLLLYLVIGLMGLSAGRATAQNGAPDAANTNSVAFQIHPMTQVNVAEHLGYFGDPYPIHLTPWLTPLLPQYFSGTTAELLQCERPIKPGCFSSVPITVRPDKTLQSDVESLGNVFGVVINRNIYQATSGSWEMAVTFYVHPKANSKTKWTVVAHARPDEAQASSSTPPTSWTADKILIGSLASFDFANYDGKYFEDGGKLYLVYSKRLISTPVAHDGIVAQEMEAPATPASSEPVVLLAPNNEDGGFNSEFFHTIPAAGDSFKLIETGNITKINGKYVMAYSVGDFQQRDYKTGVAYSDTFLPAGNDMYWKVLQNDASGIWGQPQHPEVRYLLQSQEQQWPNYVADQVIGPGVPSIVQEPGGKYFLYFDGFLPGDTPPASNGNNPLNFLPNHRRPFYVDLNVRVPADGSVSATTEAELVKWITPTIAGPLQ